MIDDLASSTRELHAWVLAPGAEPLDPLSLLRLPAAQQVPQFYFASPANGEAVCGYALAAQISVTGADRLAEASRRLDRARGHLSVGGDLEASELEALGGPRWFVGFSFAGASAADAVWDGFPPAWLGLPEAMAVSGPHGAWLAVARLERDTARRDAGHIRDLTAEVGESDGHVAVGGPVESVGEARPTLVRRVEAALEAIDRGEVEKVVVGTQRHLRLAQQPDPRVLLDSLRRRQPGCFHFLFSPQPGLALVGASPERLVRLADGRLTAMALAGSTSRGSDADEDAALGEALLGSEKDLAEHRLVVEAIARALAEFSPEIPSSPRLLQLAKIQHLLTPIEAAVPGGADVLELARRLHPTPALGGTPREAALRLIAELEPFDRGWFGGAVGWVDARGEGDLAVAIRSALVHGRMLTVFAGAGIVAGSDPGNEAQELTLKLDSTLDALGIA